MFFCDELNYSFNFFLYDLNLLNIKIKYIFNDSFLCFFVLRYLYLKYIEIIWFDDNIFSFLGFLKYLEIGNLKGFIGIFKYVFNSLSFFIMKFIDNNFDFERKKYFLKYLFKFCVNVMILDFSGNYFLMGFIVEEIFKFLIKLVILILINNRMDIIYEYIFRLFKVLKEIWLDENKFIGWKENVF